MALLPIDIRSETEKLIEDGEIENQHRSYLGISSIGEKCARKIWYAFRFCASENLTPRKRRLLSRGHREEPIIIEDLEKIGIKVHSTQSENIAGNGHIKGHIDGKADNIPDAPKTTHLLEFKTANNKNFLKFKKTNNLKIANIIYYTQAICYMFLEKLSRALFIVVNKDTDERYYERVKSNDICAKEIIQRGFDIISAEIIPKDKIGNSSWFECKWCSFYNICHFGEDVKKTCRSCTNCDMHDDGVWKCSKYNIELTFGQQLIACDKYELMETLKQ